MCCGLCRPEGAEDLAPLVRVVGQQQLVWWIVSLVVLAPSTVVDLVDPT